MGYAIIIRPVLGWTGLGQVRENMTYWDGGSPGSWKVGPWGKG